jgi:hypothetical protein
MSNGNYALDQILEESFTAGAAARTAVAGAEALDFRQYWPYIKKFLEWAKSQTSNFIVKFIIEGLIKLGDRRCGQ